VAKESDRGGYDIMVGYKEKNELPLSFHVMDEFPIALSHENIINSFFFPRTVEGTDTEERIYQS